jgi:large subunit ribosomal protein L31
MKEGIHPTYFTEATVVCACGNTWKTGSTIELIQTDVCSQCHPFYTGEQRIVDTEGQVDRFYKKLEARQQHIEDQQTRVDAKTSPETPVEDLELSTRAESALKEAGLDVVGQVLALMEKGDQPLLEIDGFGRKSLADLKRALKRRGFELPEAALEPQV